GSAASYSWVVDRVSPFVQSISRTAPTATITNASSVAFTVTFSEAVVNVDPSDFAFGMSGSTAAPTAQVVPISQNQYVVTVNGIPANGTLGLNLVDDGSIRDAAGNRLIAPDAA